MGSMTQDEMKAVLMKDMEAEIDELVRAHGPSDKLTLTQIEDLVLEARQRMGQKLAERMIELQEQARGAAIPVSPETGMRMQPKGKKTKP
jgi:adenosyl cobinamide kinase/adenosyl cobinamide phosphate guanylyltransferase